MRPTFGARGGGVFADEVTLTGRFFSGREAADNSIFTRAVPEGSRMALNGNLGGRKSERVFPAVDAYLEVAQRFGIDPVHMALAWSLRRPFVASSIFGATTMAQLEHLLGAVDVTLSDELLEALDETHKAHPLPY